MLIAVAIILACFFALNIGASGTAAAMGAAYGSGAIRKRMIAVLLVGVVALLGSIFGGGEVAKTISSGVVADEHITISITIIIIASSALTLFVSNKMGIPLSTSEVTVGSLVGVGIIFQALYIWNVLGIILVWIIVPITAYWSAKGIGKGIEWIEKRWLYPYRHRQWFKRTLVGMLVFFGCYEAFAAGMNNVANAIGPLIASDVIPAQTGLLLGGVFMCVGALMLGGPVLETNAKKITQLSLLQGSVVSFTSGSLVIVASLFGIPVPLTQATTMSIVGIGSNQSKVKMWKHSVVKRILWVWVLSPIAAMITSFSLLQLYIDQNPFPLLVLICAIMYMQASASMHMRTFKR